MKAFLTDSVFFGALLSLAGYELGLILKKRLLESIRQFSEFIEKKRQRVR